MTEPSFWIKIVTIDENWIKKKIQRGQSWKASVKNLAKKRFKILKLSPLINQDRDSPKCFNSALKKLSCGKKLRAISSSVSYPQKIKVAIFLFSPRSRITDGCCARREKKRFHNSLPPTFFSQIKLRLKMFSRKTEKKILSPDFAKRKFFAPRNILKNEEFFFYA